MPYYITTMLKLLATYFLTLLTTLTFAQSFDAYIDTFKASGKVISSNTGNPISDGLILISRTKGYRPDSVGNFTLYGLSRGRHKITFSAPGYNDQDTTITISDQNISHFTWTIHTNCWNYNKEKALKDIESNKPTLILQGGIAPIVYSSDKNFENKYKVLFNDFGCVAGDRQECLIAYNRTIFEYLDKTYGKKWRKEIRKDVIGLRAK